MADYSELKCKAQEIRNEVKAGANTANRVGLALEELVNALEAEEQRAMEREISLGDSIQVLQNDTEDLQSMRDAIDVLGTNKADKSALEATNKAVEGKQDKLHYYTENASTDTAVIKVSHDTDEATLHEYKVEVGVDNCVLLKSEDLLLGEDSYIKVSPEKVSMSSPQGKIDDAVGALVSNANAIATLNGTGEGSVSKTVTDEIAKVVADAPSDLDTLKEIADYIASDKTNAADINNTLTALKTRVYELGDFPTTGKAEEAAKAEAISKNRDISIIHYTVNGSTSHIILQDVNEDLTQQVLYYAGNTYIRHIGANLYAGWKKTNPTNIKYNQDSHRIALMHMVNQYGEGDNNIDWVELPTATTTKDGLMTKAQVQSLEGKQDKLANYVEEPRGKTTITYPNGTARVEVSNVRAALWANDDKVAITADANGTRMLYQKTAEDGSIEHRDEISIGKHGENSATHITLLSKSTTEDTGEKITTTSTLQVNPEGISMSSPEGEINDVVKEISDKADKSNVEELQKTELKLSVLDNGNIVLSNNNGESKEFMPATPSGDPMHWAYVSAGAEYNATGADIVKDAPWKDFVDTEEEKQVVHKAGHWYLNGVGDMTNDDIRYSYTNRTLLYDLNKRATRSNNNIIRTIYPAYVGASVSAFGPTKASSFFGCSRLEIFLLSDMSIVRKEPDFSLSLSSSYEFQGCKALKAIGQVTPTNTDNNRFAGCTSLRYIWVYGLKVSINLKDSSLISKLSVKYMIDNCSPTSAITITLHADAYTRMANDEEVIQALEAKNTSLTASGGSIGLVSA